MPVEPYKFDDVFEVRVALTCAINPDFWAVWGVHLEPEAMGNPACALLVRTVRSVAADLGRGPSDISVVFQRLRRQVTDGKVSQKELDAVTDLLDEDPGRPDELAVELKPVFEVRLKQAAARAAIDSYAGHGDTSKVTTLLDQVSSLGRRRDDIGIIFGPQAEQELAKLRNVSRLSTGILELDVLMRGGTPKKETCVIIGGYKTGKCHKIGQLILMADGRLERVENIRVGDRVMGPDGAPRNVLATNTGEGEMFEIRPARGRPWVVNADHVLTLIDYTSQKVGVRGKNVIDVSLREYLSWPLVKRDGHRLLHAGPVDFGNQPELPLDPYFLGVLLGDGSFTQRTVTVCTTEPEVVVELSRQCALHGLHLNVNATNRSAPSYGLSGVAGCKNPVAAHLETLGLRFHGAETKFVPAIYRTASMDQRREILAGLLDTDGYKAGAAFEFSSKSPQLAEDVAFLARSLGLSATIRRVRNACQTGAVGTYYRVAISGDVSYVPCRVPRRQHTEARQRDPIHHRSEKFVVVPTNTVEPYYGFSLDGDSRYLLDDFTITHNSMSLNQIGATSLVDGHTTVYASLELEKSLIFARFQACLTGVPIDDILETPQGEALAKSRLEKLWPRLGTLVVEKFPRRGATATDVTRWVERVQQQLGRKVDVFLLDYLDELVTENSRENGSEYAARGAVLAKLSEWNIDNDVWFWTATQTKRGSGKDPNRRTSGDDVADSIKTMRIVDKAITITNKGDDMLEWFIAANRTGVGNKAVGPFPADFACARVAPVTFDQPW